MIDRLMAEATAEAEEKAYCDEEMAKTEEKKGELEDDIEKLQAKIDKATAASATLKEEVAELQAEIAAHLELGLSGVRRALEVLREYYGGAELLQSEAKFG